MAVKRSQYVTLVRLDKSVAQGDIRVSLFCEPLYSSNMSDRPSLHIIRTSESSRMLPKNVSLKKPVLKTRTRPFKTGIFATSALVHIAPLAGVCRTTTATPAPPQRSMGYHMGPDCWLCWILRKCVMQSCILSTNYKHVRDHSNNAISSDHNTIAQPEQQPQTSRCIT